MNELTGIEVTDTPDYLRTGDILVTAAKGHTAIVLNNGDRVDPRPPEPPKPDPDKCVEVIGKSVRIRSSDSVLGRTQFIAHKGDTFPLIGIAPSGWYQIETDRDGSYITSKEKYTKLIEV